MTLDRSETVGGNLYRSSRGTWHQWFVLATSLIAVMVAITLPHMSLEQQFWIILLPVALFGLSHGGADPLILRQLVAERPRALALAFILYICASLAFISLIWFFPVWALVVFLALSIWHFGFTDLAYLSPSGNAVLLWLSGSLPLLGPVLGHPQQTSELFAWLIGREAGEVLPALTVAGPIAAALWLAGFGFLVARHHRYIGLRVLAELVLVGAVVFLLPPLLAFTFYFCLIHSVRHFLAVADNQLVKTDIRQVVGFLVKNSAPATIIAIGLALATWGAVVVWNPASSLLVEAVRVMFWGLAALTVPHAFVVKWFWDRSHGAL
ncbi:Brp/Blh family beta-carotene 15,15'-dioxygenase [Marinobacter sp. ATCH36]|uniref:Brp/Blh family beta-carotene 15,15'-dioxygenase n=1 Tax=Marinobacter sp. ATCH36 TaxID=2945106 RepID=UPI0020204076|nr:Brp/Blh family beta-carotene 15,15'-dioxygenase [Marinobacter sp. ATCH36]MCL7945510.1 Brp/Blh family beta-carotene 15,15'-dioxygenase [Marinobacter sp. ATCH36]